MSSAASPSNPIAAAAATQSPLTFWCYVCDVSVSLLPSPSPLLCPHCRRDFLEELDLPHPDLFLPHPPPPPPLPLLSDDSDNDLPNFPSDYLRRLVHHLTSSSDDDSSSIPLPPPPLPPQRRGPSPASPSSIDALPTVQISDPSLPCAVCKDDFPLLSPARRLPCGHLYHSDCIIPWLSLHNSCPICRSELPSPSPDPSLPPTADAARGFRRRLNDGEDRGR
ncbi:uncharacterized protein [Typha latifolia]|uniref:uncharacterized protein n=1 Tax=Typha latifolia TaxID=4733 RepID=UPI003C2EB54C